ncbi:MAG: TRC40/GET3/ArsA family transport-energizing ATPase [Bacteroidota bacterium]
MEQKIIFFIGKGGVGKSTVSALTSLNHSNLKNNTLLVSLDPAHNQQDIFQHNFSEKATEIKSNLFIIEIDIDRRIKQYLSKTSQKIQNNYNYQSAFSLKNYFKVLKHSPGIEEYAMLQAFEDITSSNKDKEIVIFDMPPTALTLRFFSLPKTSIIWLDQLMELRDVIHRKKETISKVKFGKREIETDRVKNQLKKLIKQHSFMQQIFQSENTKINIVLNNDLLSVNESIRIYKKLKEMELGTAHFILNKAAEKLHTEKMNLLPEKPLVFLSKHNKQLIGLSELISFLRKKEISENLLSL